MICGVYVAVAFVPFSSSPWIVTGLTSPTYVLSVGVNTAVGTPSTTLSVYVPTTFPFGSFAGTSVAGCPSSPNNV